MSREISWRKRQEVVRLYFEGLSYDDIAARTGLDKGSVVNIIGELRHSRVSGTRWRPCGSWP